MSRSDLDMIFVLQDGARYNVAMANLRQTLYAWRDNEAAKKGIELFRVLPNTAIDDIVRALPKTKEELTAIKGIKDAKFSSYGMAILSMIKEHGGTVVPSADLRHSEQSDTMMHIGEGIPVTPPKEERKYYSVSSYLDVVNRELWRLRAPIKGEVTSFKFQGNAVYFSIRDNDDGAVLSVFMWTSDFTLAGIELAEGLEVVVEGRGEIYKPSGRFNFRAETIELVGEGAYKKAYDALKKNLEAEGLFAQEKKRQLSEHPTRIGLITSRTGAVIHDFLTNLGRFGYHISFVDARVEGASAVKDILSALSMLESKNLDVLVLVRGGGSLESLQAFNNEHVVRAIANFPATTICAIGHDKDVPLAQLAADYAPSTPTATTVLLNASWEQSVHELVVTEVSLLAKYTYALHDARDTLRTKGVQIETFLEQLLSPFREASARFPELLLIVSRNLAKKSETLSSVSMRMFSQYAQGLKNTTHSIAHTKSVFVLNDPMRQLKLGFSLLFKNGKVLRSTVGTSIGERFEARLSDGTLVAEISEKHINS
jgi:exodeoxyribonuclease VII large subunit